MEKQISQQLFDKLKAKGYKGEATLESMMIPLNEKYISEGKKLIGGIIWWVVEKDKPANIGSDFISVISGKLSKEVLTNGK